MNSKIKKNIKHTFPYLSQKYIVSKTIRVFNGVTNFKNEVKKRYFDEFGIALNLNNPKTFYEKVNYLKINSDLSKYSFMVDKITAKEFAKGINNDIRIAKTIASFSAFSDFKKYYKSKAFPNLCVVKLNHTSGDVFFYKNGNWFEKHGNQITKREVFGILKARINLDYYMTNFETCYLGIKKQIMIEEYFPSLSGLDEFKIFCNFGIPKMVNVVYGRQTGMEVSEVFTDENLKPFPVNQGLKKINENSVYAPKCWKQMIEFAKNASRNFPMLRVDMLVDGENFYFCEFTFYDYGGNSIFYPLEWNKRIGDLFKLEEND